jgi:hypothetical protein
MCIAVVETTLSAVADGRHPPAALTAGAEILQSSGDDSGIAPDDFDGIDIFADQLFAAHVGAGLQQSELESWGIS